MVTCIPLSFSFCMWGQLARSSLEWLPHPVSQTYMHIDRLDALYLGHLKVDEYEPAQLPLCLVERSFEYLSHKARCVPCDGLWQLEPVLECLACLQAGLILPASSVPGQCIWSCNDGWRLLIGSTIWLDCTSERKHVCVCVGPQDERFLYSCGWVSQHILLHVVIG